MKLKMVGGKVALIAENEQEAQRFLDIAQNVQPQHQAEVARVVLPQQKVKRNYVRHCNLCSFTGKNNRSLAMHKSMTHGLRSPKYKWNRDWRAKKLGKWQGNPVPVNVVAEPAPAN